MIIATPARWSRPEFEPGHLPYGVDGVPPLNETLWHVARGRACRGTPWTPPPAANTVVNGAPEVAAFGCGVRFVSGAADRVARIVLDGTEGLVGNVFAVRYKRAR